MLIFILFLALSNVTEGFSHALEEGDLPSWVPLKPYQITRLIIFINPYMDPLDAGYQMIQSEVAIGSGGLWGKGYGEGTQVQGNFLPDHHTDFIFSVIGEEFGFVGTITIMLLYLLLLLRCLYAAISARDQLGRLIASGVTAMFACQIFINIGMTIGIMPVTGITFPLLSYGGSSMMINMIALGLVFSVYARRFV
jgi:rod shape determining protein RodA